MNDTYIFMDKDAFRFKEMLCERDRGKFEWLIQDYNDVHNENIRLLCENIRLKNQLISKMAPNNSCVVSDDYKAGHTDHVMQKMEDEKMTIEDLKKQVDYIDSRVAEESCKGKSRLADIKEERKDYEFNLVEEKKVAELAILNDTLALIYDYISEKK